MPSITILGSTGSVGTQALDVVRRNPERFKVVGLSVAGTNQELLIGQIREFLPPVVAIADEAAAEEVGAVLSSLRGVELLVGPDAGSAHAMGGDLMNPGRRGSVLAEGGRQGARTGAAV